MNNDIRIKKSFAAQQKSDYIKAAIYAPVVLLVVWVLVVGYLAVVGGNTLY